MKADIHPQYSDEAKVTCVCGHAFTTGATVAEIHVEVCSNCHPYFTGEMKYVDTLGRVEKFQKRQEHAKNVNAQKVKKTQQEETEKQPESLREMLELAKKQASS